MKYTLTAYLNGKETGSTEHDSFPEAFNAMKYAYLSMLHNDALRHKGSDSSRFLFEIRGYNAVCRWADDCDYRWKIAEAEKGMAGKVLAAILAFFVLFMAGMEPANAQTWLEEPTHIPDQGPYITTRTVLDGKEMRSFTYRYDKDNRIALWVAYPLNKGLIGEGSRTEEWTPDPALPDDVQPTLFRGFTTNRLYDRGHQIPSADRLDPEANRQTFRFTNATPQLHDFNGGIWAELEKVVRTWAKRSDTLYVVTGAIASALMVVDNDGKSVSIPKNYYKVVLRKNTWKGMTSWSMCAVSLLHENVKVGTFQENMKYFQSKAISVEQLEAFTGETYFPLLEKIVGESEYKRLKKANPAKEKWWWN